MEGFLRYKFGGLIPVFGGAYTWRGLFSEFCGSYGKISNSLNTMAPNVKSLARFKKSTLSRLKSGKRKAIHSKVVYGGQRVVYSNMLLINFLP